MHRAAKTIGFPRLACGRRCAIPNTHFFSSSALPHPRPYYAHSSAEIGLKRQTISSRNSHSGRKSFNKDSATKGEITGSRAIYSAKLLSLIMVISVVGGIQYFLVLRHLEVVPQTGRWRKMNITPQIEAQLGEDAYGSLVSQYSGAVLREDHPVTQHVREIVSTILEANDLGIVVPAGHQWLPQAFSKDEQRQGETDKTAERLWRLAVIKDDRIINSTASSGGIVVFTGLLSICKDENELAAVLSHEIAHVVARHLAERYSKAKEWSLRQLLFGSFTPNNQPKIEENYGQMMATNLHVQELEADEIGLELSARACFDPKAAIDVNERLATLEERFRRLRPELKPTHPCSEERIKRLELILPKAYEIMSKSPRCSKK